MKEQDIIDLKFEKTVVSQEESGNESFFYYTKDINEICLITNDNISANDNWEVYIFDYNMFTDDINVAKLLIDALSKMNIKKD